MRFFEADYHFNIANLVTFLNITCGVIAIYLVTNHEFIIAAILAWMAGAFDIIDGKLARKYNLSTEFGVQLDSFADFISFVVMPSFFLFFALELTSAGEKVLVGLVFVWYIISGLRRLISFNLSSDAGEVAKYFTGVPTPLGAILLWIVWLAFINGFITNVLLISLIVFTIAYSLNSKIKIPHP